jgi:hypothetical protein
MRLHQSRIDGVLGFRANDVAGAVAVAPGREVRNDCGKGGVCQITNDQI